MATILRRLTISLKPEWEPELARIKKEYFYDKCYADMLRCLIQIGLIRFDQDFTVLNNPNNQQDTG